MLIIMRTYTTINVKHDTQKELNTYKLLLRVNNVDEVIRIALRHLNDLTNM
jgi:hypothetical protein